MDINIGVKIDVSLRKIDNLIKWKNKLKYLPCAKSYYNDKIRKQLKELIDLKLERNIINAQFGVPSYFSAAESHLEKIISDYQHMLDNDNIQSTNNALLNSDIVDLR